MEQQRPRRRGGGGVHVPLFPYPLSAALWLLLLAVIVGPRAAGGFEAAEVEVHLPLPTRPALFASGRHENSSSTMGLLPDALRRMLLTTYETSGNIGTLGPQVPVILAIAPNQPVVAVNASSGRIIVADAVNTTRCIRYAPGFNATTSSSNGAARPPLDLSACLVSTTVVASAIQEISVQVMVNALVDSMSVEDLDVVGGTALQVSAPFIKGAFQIFDVTVRLAMADTPCKIRVLPGTFTNRAGEPTEGSNTLVAVWDTQPPEPIVNTIGSYQTTDQQRLPLVIDFGERVLQLNPLKLFSVTGFARLDVLYEVLEGRIFLIGSISDPEVPVIVTVTVPANVTTDIMGNPNAGVTYDLVYLPKSMQSENVGKAMSAVFALSGGTFFLGTMAINALLPLSVFPTGNNLGVMVRVQFVYLFGQLSIPTLPLNYRVAADQLGYVTLDFPSPVNPDGSTTAGEDGSTTTGDEQAEAAFHYAHIIHSLL